MTNTLEYDSEGAIFGHFCIAIITFFLVPVSGYIIKNQIIGTPVIIPPSACQCSLCGSKYKKIIASGRKIKKRLFYLLLLVALWVVYGLFFKASRNFKFPATTQKFDPFQILGVDQSASIPDIKAAYRKLLIKKHPDRGGDVEEFIMITRAFKSLSDPISRENFERYGNPDGPINPSLGIALPSWLVNKKNSKIVLIAYFLIVLVSLPAIIIMWWYYNQSFYSDKLLNTTVRQFVYFIHRTPDMKWKRILTILCSSEELSPKYCKNMVIKPYQANDMHALVKRLNIRQKDDSFLNQAYCVKARTLLFAYLSGSPIPDSLKNDLEALLQKLIPLISEFQSLMLGYYFRKLLDESKHGPNLDSFLTCLKLSASIVQGVNISDSPLLQLPYVDDQQVVLFQKRKKSLNTIQNFVDLAEKDRIFITKNFSQDEIHDIFTAIDSMPYLTFEAFVKYSEESYIEAVEMLGVVNIFFRIERLSLSNRLKNTGLNKNGEIECKDINEFKLDNLIDFDEKMALKPDKPQTLPPLYYVHSPRFPYLKKEGWWAYILNSHNQFVTSPIYFHFTKNVEYLQFRFQAPSIVGISKYKCYIMSDSYLDFTVQQEISIKVVKPAPMIENHPQWENLSDEEPEHVDPEFLTDTEYILPENLTV